MPGPLSTPNGDVRIIRGHVKEEFVCNRHADKNLDECFSNEKCTIVPLRDYLYNRNRLVTGKTR